MDIAELANDLGEPGVKLCAGHAETRQALFFAWPTVWHPPQDEFHYATLEIVDSTAPHRQ
jgi:hypothetical protein